VDEQAWARAVTLYREAIGIGDQTGNAQLRSGFRTRLARCQLLSGDPDGCLDTTTTASTVDYPSDRAVLTLLVGIARLRQGHPDQATTAFTQAITHADTRLMDAPNDYATLDARALALCGLTATGHPAALADAVATFHHARRITTAPGIIARTLRLLDQIVGTTHNDELTPARTAATGPGHQAT